MTVVYISGKVKEWWNNFCGFTCNASCSNKQLQHFHLFFIFRNAYTPIILIAMNSAKEWELIRVKHIGLAVSLQAFKYSGFKNSKNVLINLCRLLRRSLGSISSNAYWRKELLLAKPPHSNHSFPQVLLLGGRRGDWRSVTHGGIGENCLTSI